MLIVCQQLHINELYSEWKAWVATGEGAKYPPAFRVLGGDPIGGGVSVGSYIFLQTQYGWTAKPPALSNIIVEINGNLYPEESGAYFIEANPGLTTTIISNRSNLTQKVESTSSSVNIDEQSIAEAVWSYDSRTITSGTVDLSAIESGINDISNSLVSIENKLARVVDMQYGNWEVKDNQMIFYSEQDIEIARFNLLDKNNIPTESAVFKREKV